MQSASKKIGVLKIGILVLILGGVVFIQQLYMKDSRSLEQVRGLLVDLNAYCALKSHYPDKDIFRRMVAKYQVDEPKEWILYSDESLKKGTLQYPMNLPILWAPGKAKISEFLPVIYAFVITNPCQLAP